jgi:hypothetical protein
MVCIKTGPYGSPAEGDKGTLVFGADYVPGWDAGRWTVELDDPGDRRHTAASYWTESEMRESWRPDWNLLKSEKPSSAQVGVWFDVIAFYAGAGDYVLDHEVDPEDGTMLILVTTDGLTRHARFDRDGTLMGDWF